MSTVKTEPAVESFIKALFAGHIELAEITGAADGDDDAAGAESAQRCVRSAE